MQKTPREQLIYSIERRESLLNYIRGETQKKVEKIIIRPNFEKFLDKIEKRYDEKEVEEIYKFLFSVINRSSDLTSNKKPSTSNLTSIYNNAIRQLENRISKTEIKELFNGIEDLGIKNYSSITGMQSGKGIPDLKKLQEFIEFLNEKNIALNSITGMQHGNGIPDLKKLQEFIEIVKEKHIDLPEITGKQLGVDESIKLVKKL